LSEKEFKVKPTGLIENPTIVMLPDGVDHKNWIEVGVMEEHGLKIVIVAYNEKFGWLWKDGWIAPEELEKAKKGEKFRWLSSGIAGHAIP
jgi:hypothetical protein